MNTVGHLFEIHTIYEHTTAILGLSSLIMGVTLFELRGSLKNSGTRSKEGLAFLAVAMFVLSIINLLEYVMGIDSHKEWHSLSVVVFAASMELFLVFAAYMSMLCKEFATRRRICFEMGCIVLFTTPALLVSPNNHPLLFNVLFGGGITFYCVKFLCNYFEYRRQIKKTRESVVNLLSDDSSVWLKWISRTFHVVLIIGITSIFAPMTNLTVLVFYNSFILCAYFYVYISVILNISIFDKSMEVLNRDESEDIECIEQEECLSGNTRQVEETLGFMVGREKVFNNWIASRGYAVTGITATEVAARLSTNRTRLSRYLKLELNTTYYEWIATLRVEDAKRQLEEHPLRSVHEIAHSVGIEDRDNFRRVFQRYVGMSPTEYRKANLEKQSQ